MNEYLNRQSKAVMQMRQLLSRILTEKKSNKNGEAIFSAVIYLGILICSVLLNWCKSDHTPETFAVDVTLGRRFLYPGYRLTNAQTNT